MQGTVQNNDTNHAVFSGSVGLSLDASLSFLAASELKPLETMVDTIESHITNGTYGFVEVLKDEQYLTKTQAVFDTIAWAKQMVVVGIGGSDLGARALHDALKSDEPPMHLIFHGDTTDPEQLRRLQLQLQPETAVFVIISKSGETVETISQYIYWKDYFQKLFPQDWQRHFIFITDEKNGILRAEAERHEITTLPIPASVGGRFSVLTPVGLLPALAMGIPIADLLTGALQASQDLKTRQLAYHLAQAQFQYFQAGKPISVCMPYALQLEEFSRWYRQLWAESLGKNSTGILPIQSRGPADQHSQLQFYADGTPLVSLLFIRIKKSTTDFTIPETDIPEVSYLSGHSFQQICLAQQQATAEALAAVDRPSLTLTIDELTPARMGALFLTFELAVVALAELFAVNAFDQPGVEQSKQIMYRFLGKNS